MVFKNGLINGDIYIYPRPTPVAMAKKFGTKLAITWLVWEISAPTGWFSEMDHRMLPIAFTSLKLYVRTMWWYQSSKTAKIIWVTLDEAMHVASLQADFSW